MNNTIKIAFLGAGGIAQAHAYAIDALKYYYPDAPSIHKALVASPTPQSREGFARRFGFDESLPPDAIWDRDEIDALYILGPNATHTPQLLKAVEMPSLQRIYVEKPLGVSAEDIHRLEILLHSQPEKFIMVGFQFLQKSALRKALAHWKTGVFGEPIHFRADYLHSSYLDPSYRQKHPDRLAPIPQNGAMADLGSHALSLLIAFLGKSLQVKIAGTSGRFGDVPVMSDLCTTVLLEEPTTGALGTLVASRVSHGTGDLLTLEIRGTKGALTYTSTQPDCYETFLPGTGWQRHEVMSDYLPASKFPSNYAPSGWLRALVHNHYLFLGGEPGISIIPDLEHGLAVQKLIQQIAGYILKT
jgi:predicted dehydrogenase